METINEIMFRIAEYPGMLGNIILEEGQNINQKIRDNITELNIFPPEYNEFIPEMIISFLVTFSLSSIIAYILLNKYKPYDIPHFPEFGQKSKSISKSKNDTTASAVNSSNTDAGAAVDAVAAPAANAITHRYIKDGLYIESVAEVNAASDKIAKSFTIGKNYWILLRVQLRDYLDMAGTKYELHSNHIHKDTTNTKEAFQTKDFYLIMRFEIVGDVGKDPQVGNVITSFMNDINRERKYSTSDFIICAIGTSSVVGEYEFDNGVKNINYELANYIVIQKKKIGTNNSFSYMLLLPVHDVYDLFMDVYNNCIFESTKYVMDDDNFESWNGTSLNTLGF